MATKEGVDRLRESQISQEQQAILNWLTPVNYDTQQSDFISRRQAGTGQWLLDSGKFQHWASHPKQTLFCPGIPGAGKTIIASIVVEYIQLYPVKKNSNYKDLDIGMAYLYCNFQRQHEQKFGDLLTSLLKQLVQKQASIPDCVKALYDQYKGERPRLPIDEILKALRTVISSYSKVFIIIDALDECGCRTKFLSEIFKLQDETGANLFATSRHIPEILKEFKGSVSLEIRANDEDVRKYLDGQMSTLRGFVRDNLALKKEIKTAIINAVDGMYVVTYA